MNYFQKRKFLKEMTIEYVRTVHEPWGNTHRTYAIICIKHIDYEDILTSVNWNILGEKNTNPSNPTEVLRLKRIKEIRDRINRDDKSVKLKCYDLFGSELIPKSLKSDCQSLKLELGILEE